MSVNRLKKKIPNKKLFVENLNEFGIRMESYVIDENQTIRMRRIGLLGNGQNFPKNLNSNRQNRSHFKFDRFVYDGR